MAGMGPAPKPADQRRRQNVVPGTIELPMEGYQGPIPDWPFEDVTPLEEDRWEKIWKSPQASMWVRMYIDYVVARYVRVCVGIEGTTTVNIAGTNMHAEARQLEDRLGLSPLALMRLRWEIVQDEVADKRDDSATPKRRLKAVDPNVAGA